MEVMNTFTKVKHFLKKNGLPNIEKKMRQDYLPHLFCY